MKIRNVLLAAGFVTASLIAVIMLSFASTGNSGQPPMALGSTPTTATTQVIDAEATLEAYNQVVFRDFGSWEYSTIRHTYDGTLRTSIYYDHDSVSDIQNYVRANQALLSTVVQLGGRAEVAISFLPPFPPDEFRTWARQNTIQARQSQLAVGAPGGSGGTLIISGSPDDPLPDQSVGKFPFSGMGGVFGVYGTADADKLTAIAADPRVFLLDVTPAWTRHDLRQQGVADAAQGGTIVSLPYGWMERLGMVPTPVGFPFPEQTVLPRIVPTPLDDPPTP